LTKKKIIKSILVQGTVKPLRCPRCGSEIKTIVKFAYCQKCGAIFPVKEGKETLEEL